MTTEKLKHAKLSASGSDRWLNCAGSVQLQEQFKKNYAEKTNKYAEEGTAAHELAEKCLEEIKKNDFCYCSPYEFLGQTFNDFVVDEEMALQVNKYINYVYGHVYERKGKFFIENRVEFTEYVPEGFGTVDAGFIDYDANTCHVIDLKYGKGVIVSPVENNQLRMYALGFYQKYKNIIRKYEIDTFRLHIVQPRILKKQFFSYWDVSLDELLEFGEYVKERAKLALSQGAPLQAGEKQCKWCVAKPVCPAAQKHYIDDLIKEFDNLEELSPKEKDLQRVKETLDKKSQIMSYLKSVENFALKRLEKGEVIEGYELGEGRSTRKWKKDAEKIFKQHAVDAGEFFESKPISVTKAVKMLKKYNLDESEFFDKSFSKVIQKREQ